MEDVRRKPMECDKHGVTLHYFVDYRTVGGEELEWWSCETCRSLGRLRNTASKTLSAPVRRIGQYFGDLNERMYLRLVEELSVGTAMVSPQEELDGETFWAKTMKCGAVNIGKAMVAVFARDARPSFEEHIWGLLRPVYAKYAEQGCTIHPYIVVNPGGLLAAHRPDLWTDTVIPFGHGDADEFLLTTRFAATKP